MIRLSYVLRGKLAGVDYESGQLIMALINPPRIDLMFRRHLGAAPVGHR